MSRCRGRLTRWTLRGILLFGGVLAVWGLADTVADDPAQAAAPAPPCLLGDLLPGAARILGGSLVCPPPPPPDSSVERGAVRVGHDGPVLSRRQPPMARRAPVRVPAKDRPARVPAPCAGDATARASVDSAAEAMRRVMDLASPVVAEVSGTGLLEPVGRVVRPVTEPIVAVLPPALDPVLDLTEPIIGSPTTPMNPPGDPVVTAPAVTAPSTIARPVPPAVAGHPAPPSAERRPPRADRGARSPNAAPLTQMRWPGEPGHTPGVTPAAPAHTAANGSAVAGLGIPADAYLPSSAPDLHLLGLCVGGRDALADRSQQPDPRPA